jgi:glucose dehydrogenase
VKDEDVHYIARIDRDEWASPDASLRAYEAATGKELWKGALPGAPSGTPMTYVVNGRQLVVIATGDEQHGDALVAFSLGK